MHSGPLVIRRLYLLSAKPWQQLAICAVFIGVGAAVIAFGSFTGIVPILFGLILAVPATSVLRHRLWRRADRKPPSGRHLRH